MRAKDFITEAFNQPYPLKWEHGEYGGDHDALATLGDGTFLSIMFNNESVGDSKEYQVEFYRNFSQSVTGEGDSQRVFATVLHAIHKFIEVEHPDTIIFSASKDVEHGQNSESRARLYTNLVARYAAAWGYNAYNEDHGDQVTYELTRKNQAVAEDKENAQPTIGINVRSDVEAGIPYADLIVDGIKTFESRESNSLKPYIGKRVAIVKTGEGTAKAIGSVVIGEPIIVNEEQFRELEGEHMVPAGSAFDIKQGEKKYLYPVTDAVRFEKPIDVGHGIVSRKLNIDEEEMLDEGATSVLYHYTNIQPALKILQNGAFELSSSVGNPSEEKMTPKGYPYFLSTTRSKVGDYHRWVSSSAVMFVLDGDWYGNQYPVKPVDYWERMWQHSPDRTRESEDRIFSKEPTIPVGGVRAIHILMREQHEYRSPAARKLLLLAKKQDIPAYLYNDEQAWRLQDKRKALSIKQATPVLKGVEPSSRTYQSYGSLDPWFELIYKKSVAELTPKANKLRTNILYYSRPHEDNNLAIDLSNERKPNSSDRESAVRLIDYMRKNGFATPLDLKNALVAKWKDIA